jgi:hypothetical protein
MTTRDVQDLKERERPLRARRLAKARTGLYTLLEGLEEARADDCLNATQSLELGRAATAVQRALEEFGDVDQKASEALSAAHANYDWGTDRQTLNRPTTR